MDDIVVIDQKNGVHVVAYHNKATDTFFNIAEFKIKALAEAYADRLLNQREDDLPGSDHHGR